MKLLSAPILPLFRRLLRVVKRRRRFCAALLLCAAAAIAVNQLTPGNQFTEPVVTINSDLPTGNRITAEQVSLSKLPPAAVPRAALRRPEQAIGQLLTSAMREGQILTDASLLGSGLLTGAPPGSVAVPLHIADPQTISWLRTGQLVNVILSVQDPNGSYQRAQVLAEGVPVLWLPDKTNGSSADPVPGAFGSAESPASGIVLITATAKQSAALATASGRGRLSLVLTGG